MRVEIRDIDEKGRGIGYLNSRKIIVPKTLPGEIVDIKKFYKKKKQVIAREYDLIDVSPRRINPRCKFFAMCGGCSLQHVSYEDQLELKKNRLLGIYGSELGGIEIIPSPKIYDYRNRMDYTVISNGIGLREQGRWYSVINISSCELMYKSGLALKALRELMDKEGIRGYNLQTHEGIIRYLVVREGKNTGEIMINLVVTKDLLPRMLDNYFEFADSIYVSINDSLTDISMGNPSRIIGKEYIRERLLDTTYLIHPNSFFQTNSFQAENMLKIIEKNIQGERILDLYSGVGTFSIFLARREYNVIGVENNSFSVHIAEMNKKLNNINEKNARFIESEAERFNLKELGDFTTVIVDPPRPGLHPKVVKNLLKLSPERIIYVSCNPETQKRDYELLREKYRIMDMVALDMFPHTFHIETVMTLERK